MYNTSPNTSSGLSPYQVRYGSEPKTLGVQGVASSVVLKTMCQLTTVYGTVSCPKTFRPRLKWKGARKTRLWFF